MTNFSKVVATYFGLLLSLHSRALYMATVDPSDVVFLILSSRSHHHKVEKDLKTRPQIPSQAVVASPAVPVV